MLLLFLCWNCLLLFSSCRNGEERYPYGRDTTVYIGNGRFQIARVRLLDTQNYDTYIVTDHDCTSDVADIELDVFLYYDDAENKKTVFSWFKRTHNC